MIDQLNQTVKDDLVLFFWNVNNNNSNVIVRFCCLELRRRKKENSSSSHKHTHTQKKNAFYGMIIKMIKKRERMIKKKIF